MKITDPDNTNKRIVEYMETNRLNSLIRTGVTMPMRGFVFESDELEKCAEVLRQDLATEGIAYTKDEALIAMAVIDMLVETLDICDDALPVPDEIIKEIVKESRIFHNGAFEDNPFLRNIAFDEKRAGKFRLTHGTFDKYETFQYNTPLLLPEGVLVPRMAAFDHRFDFPCIMEGNTVWMSVTPNEICTMAEHISAAKGNVLTLGCGMGYYAYMVSEKEDVSSVTVVEREEDVIGLFEEHILSQFEHKEKIKIVKADAVEYMEEIEDGVFDFCFADIWKGSNDLEAYLALKRVNARFEETKISYWIEDSMMATITSYVYMLTVEALCKARMVEPPKLPEKDYALEYIRKGLADAVIESAEDVDRYMNPVNVLEILKNKNR